MTDYQNAKLRMYEKVLAFLISFATQLAGVTQIAGIKDELEDNIEDITTAESIATEDTTGYTEEKSDARIALEEIMLKVARACAAYFFSIGATGKLKMADYLPSELDNARNNDVYVKAKLLFKVADAVKTNLTAFNSGPADVTDLGAKKEAFLEVIQLPESKRGEKVASGKDVDELMSETDTLLDGLDIYMDTFNVPANANMMSQYGTARAIDLQGGGAQTSKTGTVVVGAVANAGFANNLIHEDTVLLLTNGGDDKLIFYFAAGPTTTYTTGDPVQEVASGEAIQKTGAEIGFTAGGRTKLNIFNNGEVDGSWKVNIVE